MAVMVKPVEVLERGLTLIEKPNGWIQGRYAMNDAGDQVDPENARAVGFCSNGALQRAARDIAKERGFQFAMHMPGNPLSAMVEARRLLGDEMPGGVDHYNDKPRRQKSTILKKWRNAIEKARR